MLRAAVAADRRQILDADRAQQFGGDRMALNTAVIPPFQQIGPPLQTDLARQWLADLRRAPARSRHRTHKAPAANAACLPARTASSIASEIMLAHEVCADAASARRLSLMARRSAPHATRRRFADHDVVGADRGTGLHRVDRRREARGSARANRSGGSQTSLPVPISSVSMPAAASKRASATPFDFLTCV